MTTCAELFQQMPERFQGEAAGDWKTTIQFDIAGEGGGKWVLKVADKTCTVEEGTVEGADATVQTDAETWVGINTGAVNAMQAFMGGKIKVQGNMAELMKLNNPQIFKRT